MRWTKYRSQRRAGWPVGKSARWLWAAAVIGLLNALPSWYWGAGGSWLLPSIGQWLTDWRAESPLLVGAGLFAVAAAKTVLAVLPLACWYLLHPSRHGPNQHRHLTQPSSARRRRRDVVWAVLWTMCAGAAVALVAYGAVGMVVNVALMAWPGVEPADPVARWGQALLWYPMLLVWGALLLCGHLRGGPHLGVGRSLSPGAPAGNPLASPDQRDLQGEAS